MRNTYIKGGLIKLDRTGQERYTPDRPGRRGEKISKICGVGNQGNYTKEIALETRHFKFIRKKRRFK